MNANDSSSADGWHIEAAVATWLVPGLGHFILGERGRGLIVGTSIILLWLAGFLIGGIGVFDHTDHTAWFVGQMIIAPSLATDLYLQTHLKTHGIEPMPDADPGYSPSFARINEQGILYTALAGLLNLLAMLDVVYRDPHHRRSDGPLSEPAGDSLAPGRDQ